MFEFLKKSLEDYKQEKEAPFNYNGLMSKLSNHRAETYLEISNKLKELLDTLDKSELNNLQASHKIGLPCGDLRYDIKFDNGINNFDGKSQLGFEIRSAYKNGGIFIKSSDFPKDLKTCRDKIDELSRDSLILLDDLTVHMDSLFKEIEIGISEDINIEINKLREPKKELLNTLKEKYNDTEYEEDFDNENEYDYDDR